MAKAAVAGGGDEGEGRDGGELAEQEGWGAEVDAAAAAGAAVAEEAGVSGDALVSRMALESVGLLVEGLVGQQVIVFFGGAIVLEELSGRGGGRGGKPSVCVWLVLVVSMLYAVVGCGEGTKRVGNLEIRV